MSSKGEAYLTKDPEDRTQDDWRKFAARLKFLAGQAREMGHEQLAQELESKASDIAKNQLS